MRRLLNVTSAAALPSGCTRLFGRPFVRRTLFVCGFPALAGDAPLLVSIHRCESAILFCHTASYGVCSVGNSAFAPGSSKERQVAALPAPTDPSAWRDGSGRKCGLDEHSDN